MHESVERGDLIEDEVFDGVGGHLRRCPAEVRAVRVAGMRPHPHAVGEREGNRGVHGGGVPGVQAAGHVGGGHVGKQHRVVHALADVGVQVDAHVPAILLRLA
jgi:hypothetical protein